MTSSFFIFEIKGAIFKIINHVLIAMSKGYGTMEEDEVIVNPSNSEPEFKQVISAVCNEA